MWSKIASLEAPKAGKSAEQAEEERVSEKTSKCRVGKVLAEVVGRQLLTVVCRHGRVRAEQ